MTEQPDVLVLTNGSWLAHTEVIAPEPEPGPQDTADTNVLSQDTAEPAEEVRGQCGCNTRALATYPWWVLLPVALRRRRP